MTWLFCWWQYYDFAQVLADDFRVMERGEFIARGLGKDMHSKV